MTEPTWINLLIQIPLVGAFIWYSLQMSIQLKDSQKAFMDALDKRDDPLLKVAIELERIALQDEYFVSKKLYPNIDFYSGITLRAIGFPVEMFTVLFAVARTVGWIAQWREMIEDPEQRIGRPRQLYVGPPRREFPL